MSLKLHYYCFFFLDDKVMEAESISGLGQVYQQMGEYATALRYHQNDLEISEHLGMAILQSRACGNIGNQLFHPIRTGVLMKFLLN